MQNLMCKLLICTDNFLKAFATIVLAQLISDIFDGTFRITALLMFGLLSGASLVCSLVYGRLSAQIIETGKQKTIRDYFQSIDNSDNIARISKVFETDLPYCTDYENKIIPTLVTNFIFIFIYLMLILKTNFIFSCIVATTGLLQAIFPLYFADIFSRNYEQTLALEEKIEHFYYTVITSFKKIWFFQNSYTARRLRALNESYYQTGLKSEKSIQLYNAITETISVMSQFGICFIGVLFLWHTDFSLAGLLSTIVLANQVFSMMAFEFEMLKDKKIYHVSKQRLAEITVSDVPDLEAPSHFSGLEAEDFHPVFLDSSISFSLLPGDLCLIRGRNGSGKSTLLKALLNLQKNYTGSLTLNGTDLKKLDLRNLCYYVPQNITHIDYTVEELFQQFSPEDADTVKAQFDFDTSFLSKKINELSSGQAKKIHIMCAFMSHKPILLFDEPETALDKENLQIFTDCLSAYSGTVIIATNRNFYDKLNPKVVNV